MSSFPVVVALRADQPGYLTTAQVDANFRNLAAAVNALYGPPVNDATTARTLAAGDVWKYIRMTSASANVVTVAPGVGAVGDEITVFQAGAGATSFAAGVGVTVNAAGLTMAGRYRAATLKCVAANVWDLIGALA